MSVILLLRSLLITHQHENETELIDELRQVTIRHDPRSPRPIRTPRHPEAAFDTLTRLPRDEHSDGAQPNTQRLLFPRRLSY